MRPVLLPLLLAVGLPVPLLCPLPASASAGAQNALLMLASPWPQPAPDLRQLLFSEKLDGVRARWDGHRLSTRNGNPIAVPDSFTAGWPQQAMDGELWLGRGRFQAISALVRRSAMVVTSPSAMPPCKPCWQHRQRTWPWSGSSRWPTTPPCSTGCSRCSHKAARA